MTRHSQDFRVPLAVADKLEAASGHIADPGLEGTIDVEPV